MTTALVSGIDWKEVEAFFYRVMVNGWVGGAKPEPGHQPGSKRLSFSEGKYRLNDEWFSFPGGTKSAGTTTIYLDSAHGDTAHVAARWVPIWFMQYHGEYTKEQAAFVKQMLAREYGAGRSPVFCGCRGLANNGPYIDVEHKFAYHNRLLNGKMTFEQFAGTETVLSGGNARSGYHDYVGMALV